MGITVREVWQLKEFQPFILAAGAGGLDREIKNIGMLDYEFALQYDENPRKWNFRKGDFVLSSLLFAKEKPELLLPAIMELCSDQVAALAVKNVCFCRLPDEVFQYADEHDLPVFMFGREDAYFEDIVVTLRRQINDKNNLDLLEYRISLLLDGQLDLKGQRELQKDMLRRRNTAYRIAYCMPTAKDSTIRDFHRCYRLDESSFFYKKGCFMIQYDPDSSDSDKAIQKAILAFRENLNMPFEQYQIGFSNIHNSADELSAALKESCCALMYAQLFEKEYIRFQKMGIYKALLPNLSNSWLNQFEQELIEKLLDYDREYDSCLYETLKNLVKFHGNIHEVSEAMHLHKNTIRYRINKARELLNMEEDLNFDLEISIAFMLDEINQRFGN